MEPSTLFRLPNGAARQRGACRRDREDIQMRAYPFVDKAFVVSLPDESAAALCDGFARSQDDLRPLLRLGSKWNSSRMGGGGRSVSNIT
jgi:hypothetical protein